MASTLTLESLAQIITDGMSSMNRRFDAIDERLDGIDARLDGIDARLDNVEISNRISYVFTLFTRF